MHDVVYVPAEKMQKAMDEPWLADVLGPLPEKPKVIQIPHSEAVEQEIIMVGRDGKDTMLYSDYFRNRYELSSDGSKISFPNVEVVELILNAKETEAGLRGQFNQLKYTDGNLEDPTKVVVPLELRDGVIWAHLTLVYRADPDAWWTNIVGGYSIDQAASEGLMVQLDKQFGDAKVLHTMIEENVAIGRNATYHNRSISRNFNANGHFLFDGPSWEPATEGLGFQAVGGMRLAVELMATANVLNPDTIVASALTNARADVAGGAYAEFLA